MATEFGKRLRDAREHAGLTQEQLCARVRIAQSTLAAAESRGFGSRKTPQLAAACGVNPQWLATGDGHMLDGLGPGAPPSAATPAPLSDSLLNVAQAIAELSTSQWHMVRARLDSLPGAPLDAEGAVQDVAPVFEAAHQAHVRAISSAIKTHTTRLHAKRINFAGTTPTGPTEPSGKRQALA